MLKKKPTGFIATCQCGAIVGAMDYERTDRREAGQMLGRWLHDGCTITPQFAGTWRATVEACRCNEPSVSEFGERPATANYPHGSLGEEVEDTTGGPQCA